MDRFDLLGALLTGDPTRIVHGRGVVEASEGEAPSREQVREAEVSAATRFDALEMDPQGFVILEVDGQLRSGGRFTLPTIGELRSAVGAGGHTGRPALSVLLGATPVTDIGALLAVRGGDGGPARRHDRERAPAVGAARHRRIATALHERDAPLPHDLEVWVARGRALVLHGPRARAPGSMVAEDALGATNQSTQGSQFDGHGVPDPSAVGPGRSLY